MVCVQSMVPPSAMREQMLIVLAVVIVHVQRADAVAS